MLASIAEHTSTLPGSCRRRPDSPMRAARSEGEVQVATERLVASLADCAEFDRVRDQAWLLAESVRLAEIEGKLSHRAALRCFDLLGICWAMSERMDRGWRCMDHADARGAMECASNAGQRINALEPLLQGSTGLLERLRGRTQALWHLADALDEATFLADCNDHAGARARAKGLLEQLEVLGERRVLGPDEHDIAESAAARWGARPSTAHRGSWAS